MPITRSPLSVVKGGASSPMSVGPALLLYFQQLVGSGLHGPWISSRTVPLPPEGTWATDINTDPSCHGIVDLDVTGTHPLICNVQLPCKDGQLADY